MTQQRGQAAFVPEVRTVAEWHEALNAGEVERLAALSHPDVEVGGPRGSGRGTRLLREWIERANIRLHPLRLFHRTRTVVVEEEAEWHSTDTSEASGRHIVASVFVVSEGRVARVARHNDLAGALEAAGLDESHETRPGSGRPRSR